MQLRKWKPQMTPVGERRLVGNVQWLSFLRVNASGKGNNMTGSD